MTFEIIYYVALFGYAILRAIPSSKFEWYSVFAGLQLSILIHDAITSGHVSWFTEAVFALFVYLAWRNRPRGKFKKVKKAIGDKTKAIIARMVEVATPARVPAMSPA